MFRNMHPARLMALLEAIIAAIAAFAPLSGQQVGALMAVVAIGTGERVVKKVAH